MSVIGDVLFFSRRGQPDLSDVLRHNLENGVSEQVDRISASEFDAKSDGEIAEEVFERCKAEPLVLKLAEADADVRNIQVEVSDFFSGAPVRVAGLRVVKMVPYDGEREFFELQPSTFDLNPPRGEVRGSTLIVGMEVRESEGESALQYIEETLAKVQENIGRQLPQIEEHNRQLPGVAAAAIQRRRSSLGKASDLAARLRGQ